MSLFDRNGLDRRNFLKSAAGLGAALVAAGHSGASLASATELGAPNPWTKHMGLEMFTVRDVFEKDPEGTLARVAQLGYKEIEPTSYAKMTPQQFRAALDRNGLTAPSTHVGIRTGPDFEQSLEGMAIMGTKYLTVSTGAGPGGGPRPAGAAAPGVGAPGGGAPGAAAPGSGAPPAGPRVQPARTVAMVQQEVKDLNAAGQIVKKHGMKILIHNHTNEFAPLADRLDMTQYDVYLKEADPSVVVMQLDIGWARVAGQDVLGLFRQYPGRFPLWHVKDMADLKTVNALASQAERQRAAKIVPVGMGDINYAPIFAMAKQAGLEHFCIEQDTAVEGDSLAAAKTSYDNLVRQLA